MDAICESLNDKTTAHVQVTGTKRCACGAVVFPFTLDDYRALLKKYMGHVHTCTADTFLDEMYRSSIMSPRTPFTDDEWAELQRLDREA